LRGAAPFPVTAIVAERTVVEIIAQAAWVNNDYADFSETAGSDFALTLALAGVLK
jgi:hypothetical protein